jgi:hypothetical protein
LFSGKKINSHHCLAEKLQRHRRIFDCLLVVVLSPDKISSRLPSQKLATGLSLSINLSPRSPQQLGLVGIPSGQNALYFMRCRLLIDANLKLILFSLSFTVNSLNDLVRSK